MEDVTISDESLKFVCDLIAEIDGQDNRCTAKPYFYVIRDKETRAVPDHCGDEKRYAWDGDLMTEEQVREIAEEPTKDIEDIVEESKGTIEGFDVVEATITPENHNVFFTEKACVAHLESNRHHFRDPNNYIRHAFRNPEMVAIFKVLREIAGVG